MGPSTPGCPFHALSPWKQVRAPGKLLSPPLFPVTPAGSLVPPPLRVSCSHCLMRDSSGKVLQEVQGVQPKKACEPEWAARAPPERQDGWRVPKLGPQTVDPADTLSVLQAVHYTAGSGAACRGAGPAHRAPGSAGLPAQGQALRGRVPGGVLEGAGQATPPGASAWHALPWPGSCPTPGLARHTLLGTVMRAGL